MTKGIFIEGDKSVNLTKAQVSFQKKTTIAQVNSDLVFSKPRDSDNKSSVSFTKTETDQTTGKLS